jgi:hypothetical protein
VNYTYSSNSYYPIIQETYTISEAPNKREFTFGVETISLQRNIGTVRCYIGNNTWGSGWKDMNSMGSDIWEASLTIKTEGDYWIWMNITDERGFNTYNYSFISIRKPYPFDLWSDANDPDNDGLFKLNWDESLNTVNYSLYSSNNTITEFNSSVYLIMDGLTQLYYDIVNYEDGLFYYIIVAYNDFGNTSSNCLEIYIDKNPKDFILSIDLYKNLYDFDGILKMSWTESLDANNYSIYYSYNESFEFEDLTLIKANITDLSFITNALNDSTYFLIVIAFNNFGNNTSNLIKVIVDRTITIEEDVPFEDIEPNYWGIIILIISISIGVLIGVVLYLRKKGRFEGSSNWMKFIKKTP